MAGKKLRIIIKGRRGHGKSTFAALLTRKLQCLGLPAKTADKHPPPKSADGNKLVLDNLYEWPNFYESIDIEVEDEVEEPPKRTIRLAVIDPDPTLDRVLVKDVEHREDISGWNVIAVLAGALCKEGPCAWCDKLRTRCQSRRLA
jgi:hypothetical protein